MRVPPKLLFLLRLALICLSVLILSLPLAGRADAPDGSVALQLAQADDEQPPAEGRGGEAVAEPPPIDSGDTAWMLTSTALVVLMTIPGLALFYGGMVRKMNVLSVLMQRIRHLLHDIDRLDGPRLQPGLRGGRRLCRRPGSDAAFRTHDRRRHGHHSRVGLHDLPDDLRDHHPALIVGAFVERMKFSAMLVFIVLWSLIVYAPIAHWVWGPGGFLLDDGVLDFRRRHGGAHQRRRGRPGSALVLGKRQGYGREPMPPHNLTLSLIGASLLWVGWFGFNAGSAAAANGRAGMAMAVTQIATAAAALTWMFAEWLTRSKPSLLGIISGAIGAWSRSRRPRASSCRAERC